MTFKNINGSECILCKYPLSSKQPKRLQNAQNVFVTGNRMVHCYDLNTWEMGARLGIQGWRWLHSTFKESVENRTKQNSQKGFLFSFWDRTSQARCNIQ